jgi:hypothetical protein
MFVGWMLLSALSACGEKSPGTGAGDTGGTDTDVAVTGAIGDSGETGAVDTGGGDTAPDGVDSGDSGGETGLDSDAPYVACEGSRTVTTQAEFDALVAERCASLDGDLWIDPEIPLELDLSQPLAGLEQIGGDLRLDHVGGSFLSLPALTAVGEKVSWGAASGLESASIQAPALVAAEALTIDCRGYGELPELFDLSGLETLEDLYLLNCGAQDRPLSLPSLTTIADELTVSDASLSATALSSAGTVRLIRCSVDLSGLTTATYKLYFYLSAGEPLSLPALNDTRFIEVQKNEDGEREDFYVALSALTTAESIEVSNAVLEAPSLVTVDELVVREAPLDSFDALQTAQTIRVEETTESEITLDSLASVGLLAVYDNPALERITLPGSATITGSLQLFDTPSFDPCAAALVALLDPHAAYYTDEIHPESCAE